MFPKLLLDSSFHGYKDNFSVEVPKLTVKVFQKISIDEAICNPQVPFLQWFIEGDESEFENSLSNLPTLTGFQDELWLTDVCELFIANPKKDEYLEIEISPNDSWLALEFDSIRNRNEKSIEPDEFDFEGIIPIIRPNKLGANITYNQIKHLIKDNKLRIQSAISKEEDQSYFLAPNWNLDNNENPNFHQLERFTEVKLD